MKDYTIIYCIVNIGYASKALKAARSYGASSATIFYGRSALRSRMLEFLGLDEVRKEIIVMLLETELANTVVAGVSHDMEFHKANHGIAFTMPVCELINSKTEIAAGSAQILPASEYKLIYTVVEKGRADEVVNAANRAGATGATIINARGGASDDVRVLFSIEIKPEKENVLIIAKSVAKDSIVQSIRSALLIDEPGNGVLFVHSVNSIYGLRKD